MSSSSVRSGVASGLDHAGIVTADLDALAAAFLALGFHLTPCAAHASGRTANRCVMLPDGGYLELMAAVPGQTSATLDRFLGIGAGAHILALEIDDEAAARARLSRAGLHVGEALVTERLVDQAAPEGPRARFHLLTPPDAPEGRVLLIRHATRDLLWRPEVTAHPNGALSLEEAVYAAADPATAMTWLSRLSGQPFSPDPLGGYRLSLGKGAIRVLPRAVAASLFPCIPAEAASPLRGMSAGPALVGLTLAARDPRPEAVHVGGVALRFAPVSPTAWPTTWP